MSTKAERKKLHGTGKEYWRRLGADLQRDKWLYFLLLPGLIYFIIFKYLPMFGIVIAFENYVPYSGVLGSEWVGLKWFQYFFRFPAWVTYLTNTLILSFMNIVFYFPAPIILALLLNEMRSLRYKKLLQTLLYVPHFISIVIVVSITFVMFGTSGIIYKLNPDVKVISMGITAPFRGLQILDGVDEIMLSRLNEEVIVNVRNYMTKKSPYRNRTTYVEVGDVPGHVFYNVTNPLFLPEFILDVHPTREGHNTIAKRIGAKL